MRYVTSYKAVEMLRPTVFPKVLGQTSVERIMTPVNIRNVGNVGREESLINYSCSIVAKTYESIWAKITYSHSIDQWFPNFSVHFTWRFPTTYFFEARSFGGMNICYDKHTFTKTNINIDISQ